MFKRKKGKIKTIKDVLKSEFGLDLVIIQCGYYFEIIEEDAEFFNRSFRFKLHNCGGSRPYQVTGFPKNRWMLNKYKKLLSEKGINYAIVDQVDVQRNHVTREVTHSTNDDALGLVF
tara:strand:- start:111 stop:461 length:351 start_codon:yes stop_codon:yes gene_type:complete